MITKRGKTFWLDIWCGPKRIRRSLHTTERVVALERAQRVAEELRKPKPSGAPLGEFIDKYLAWALETKPASYRAEKFQAPFIKSWFAGAGILTLEAITPYHVEQFRQAVRARDRRSKDRKDKNGDIMPARTASKATANRYCALLRRIINKATDWGTFSGTNPVSKVRFYPEREKVRPLAEADIERILAEADALAARPHATALQREAPAMFRFIVQTGLRRSEALGLKWADVIDGSIIVKGKGEKTRSVPLNAEARAVLASRRRATAFVFDVPGRDSVSLLRRLTGTISRNAGVHFTVHALRHVFASRLLAAGVDVVSISSLLGHSAYMTTLLYAHSSPRLMRAAVDALPVTEHGHRTDSLKQAEAE